MRRGLVTLILAVVVLLSRESRAQTGPVTAESKPQFTGASLERYWSCMERNDLEAIKELLWQHKNVERVDASIFGLPEDDFDDDFDDPVDFRKTGKVVLKIAHRDQTGEFRDRQGCRAHFQKVLLAVDGKTAAHRGTFEGESLLLFLRSQLIRNNVQHEGRNPHIGQVGRNGRAHHAGSQYGCFFDFPFHASSDLQGHWPIAFGFLFP